ncbi:hypothetical protein Ancab_040332 [Ancistrocladus abbreviatus]
MPPGIFESGIFKEARSFFFTNFPEGIKIQTLWQIFGKLGKAVDVFIPGKKTRGGRCFGFVKFIGVRNAHEMETKLNEVWIGSFKLIANLARFDRKLREMNSGFKPWGKPSPVLVPGLQKSYAEVLSSQNRVNAAKAHSTHAKELQTKDRDFSFHFQSKQEDGEWLDGCFVGEVRELEDLDSLQDNLQNAGVVCSVRSLGGRSVLLATENPRMMHSYVEGERMKLSRWFASIRPWSPLAVDSRRLCWVRSYGIPLHVWTWEFFAEIASIWGILVQVDQGTREKSVLSYARLAILTSLPRNLDDSINVQVDGHAFAFSVIEEGPTVAANSDHPYRSPRNKGVQRMNIQHESSPIVNSMEVRRNDSSGDQGVMPHRAARAALVPSPVLSNESVGRSPDGGGQIPVNSHASLHSSCRHVNPIDLDPRATELQAAFRGQEWGSISLGTECVASRDHARKYGPEGIFGAPQQQQVSGQFQSALSTHAVLETSSMNVGEGDTNGGEAQHNLETTLNADTWAGRSVAAVATDTQKTYSRKGRKKKKMAELLNLCMSSEPQQNGGSFQQDGQQEGGVSEGNSSCGVDSFSDSLIGQRNKKIVESLNQEEASAAQVTPTQIWNFLAKIGVQGDGRDGEMIDRIAALEERDEAMYVELQKQQQLVEIREVEDAF